MGLAHKLSRLKSALQVEVPTTRGKLAIHFLGKKGIWGVWTFRLIFLVGFSGIIFSLFPINYLGNRLIAIGASLQLLSVPLLATVALQFFTRPPQPERHVGDVHLPGSTAETEQAVLMGFTLGPLLGLPKLSNMPFVKILPWLTVIGLALIVVGLILQIIGALIT